MVLDYQEESNVKLIPTKIMCDKCEDIIDVLDFDEEAVHFEHTFGFGSKNDGTLIRFDLCESCLFDLLDNGNVNYELIDTTPY